MRTLFAITAGLLCEAMVIQAANPCVENPQYGTWTCAQQGSLNSPGTVSQSIFRISPGQGITAPTVTGVTFNSGKKTRQVAYQCPSVHILTETQSVAYVVSGSAYFRDSGGAGIPGSFPTAGTYTYAVKIDGVPNPGGGPCSTVIATIGSITVYVCAVGTLTPEVGVANPGTSTFAFNQEAGTLKVYAVPDPGVDADNQLPTGWLMRVNGVSQGAVTTVSINRSVQGSHTIDATSGTSSKQITVNILPASTADSDYDGVSDAQERKDGTDPLDPASFAEKGLGYFPLDTGSWLGGAGQSPLTILNLQSVLGRRNNAALIESSSPSKLIYRDAETNGAANFNARRGTIRFWVKPNWNSTGLPGGAGPLSEARLVEVGNNTGSASDEWWGLTINAAGTQLSLGTKTNGNAANNFAAAIAWTSNQWHQVVVCFSPQNALVFIDGQNVVAAGAGVLFFPGAGVRGNGVSIGSDKQGNRQINARIDEVDIFNFQLVPAAVQQGFAGNPVPDNSCNLYPIGLPQNLPAADPQTGIRTINLDTAPGNFSWLKWDGRTKGASPDELIASLTAPGNSQTTYYNPENQADRVISVGDPIRGDTGISPTPGVHAALNTLIQQNTQIIVPVYSQIRDSGSNAKYIVASYARIRLTGYNFSNPKTLSFVYINAENCNVVPNQAPTLTSVATLTGATEDTAFPISFETLASAANEADADGPYPTLFRVESISSGTLTLDGASVQPGTVWLPGQVFYWTPPANANGIINAFTIKAWDGALASASAVPVSVNVAPFNDQPTITPITNQTIDEDTSTGPIGFTVGDIETAAGSLTVSGSSSNPTLIPNGSIVFGGSGANRTVTLTPLANQFGLAVITLTVSDGVLTASAVFLLTVNPVNDPPTITPITNRTIDEDTSTGPIGFTVGDIETAAGSLTVSGVSSNPGLVPTANIVFGGSGASRTVTLTPLANQFGSTTITVTVSDGQLTASAVFVLTVNPVNDPPTITPIANRTINEDTSTGPIGFTVGDLETPAGSLTVSGVSANPGLVPTANIVFGGSGASRTVTLTPLHNQVGSAGITVTVSDGQLTASTAFVLTVSPVNDPPVVDAGPDATVIITPTAGVLLNGSASDPDGDALTLAWSKVNGPGLVTFTTPNQLNPTVQFSDPGIYLLQLAASDGPFTVADTVTITAIQNRPPIVDAGPDRHIAPGGTALLQGSVIDDGVAGDILQIGWSWISGPVNVTISSVSSPVTSAGPFPQSGTYVFELHANDSVGASSDRMTVIVSDPHSITYTFNADFAKGLLHNVNFNEVPDQLQLNKTVRPFPFVYIPCSDRGTIVRVDANTGEIVGEYATAPGSAMDRKSKVWPSRTSVDRQGNLWVANSGDLWKDPGDNQYKGSVTRIGVVIGGTRTDGVKNANGKYNYVPDGNYLAPPFIYNTCIDRNNDGLIKTSQGRRTNGTHDVRPWDNGGGVDTNGGVDTADDEAIINYIRVQPTPTGQ